LRRRRETARIRERIDRAGSLVQQRAAISTVPSSSCASSRSIRRTGAPRRAHCRARRRLHGERGIVRRGVQPAAVAPQSAVDAMLVDRAVDELRRAPGEGDDALAALGTEPCDELVGIPLEAGQNLTAVTP
jgi:hypothetical protein